MDQDLIFAVNFQISDESTHFCQHVIQLAALNRLTGCLYGLGYLNKVLFLLFVYFVYLWDELHLVIYLPVSVIISINVIKAKPE